MHFFISTQRYVRGYQKRCPLENKSQKCKEIVIKPLFFLFCSNLPRYTALTLWRVINFSKESLSLFSLWSNPKTMQYPCFYGVSYPHRKLIQRSKSCCHIMQFLPSRKKHEYLFVFLNLKKVNSQYVFEVQSWFRVLKHTLQLFWWQICDMNSYLRRWHMVFP